MPRYIKSHSNYVLSKKHQEVSDGTIWERDITTIGGVNQFSPGQIPIFQDGNFIITVRNDGKVANQYNKSKWKDNEDGDVWTLESISGMTSEFEEQNDVKIVLKQDYYDFRDFAYYGSLNELFRASINDVLSRFPSELYSAYSLSGDEKTPLVTYYTSSVTVDFNAINKNVRLGGDDDTLVSNPFGINIHSVKKPVDGEVLKYFSDKGYSNYELFDGDDTSGDPIVKWESENFIVRVKSNEDLDELYGDDAFYYEYLKGKLNENYPEPNRSVWWVENKNDIVSEKSKNLSGDTREGSSGYTELVEDFQNGELHKVFLKYNNGYWVEKNGKKCEPSVGETYNTKREARNKMNELASGDTANTYSIGHGVVCGDLDCYLLSSNCKGYKTASVSATTSGDTLMVIDAWVGDNDSIVYLTNKDNVDKHIRPNEKFISNFYNECNNFEKLILDRKTTPKYKSTFSVIKENEFGFYREMEEFIFPTSYGGYNINADSFGFNDYTNRLSEIGMYYDTLFSDNLYRSMTHEAIKNFDWSFTREFTYGDEEEYIHGGEKIQKALRVFAREFDEILTYIDNIKNLNRVTYDDRNNLPNYFLIDKVNEMGWDTCLVYPYDLEEYYIKSAEGSPYKAKIYLEHDKYEEEQQLNNKEGYYPLIRQFSQNTKKEINPYSKKWFDEYPNGYFITCGGVSPCWYDGKYGYLDAEGSGTTFYDDERGKIVNRIKSYSDERAYTYMDANNEFMRRMVINSNHILHHKGTVEGIEMMLGMFGFKSKRWVDRLPKNCISEKIKYDYEIDEYSSFTNRIEEKWDAVHQMYRIDWINSTKSIVYDYRTTSNYSNGTERINYLSYQGLPISFRDEYIEYEVDEDGNYVLDENGNKQVKNNAFIKVSPLRYDTEQESTNDISKAFKNINEDNAPVRRRYLYPNFNKYEQIDGNVYFQMNGGWLSKTLQNSIDDSARYNFQYDVDNKITYNCYVPEGSDENDKIQDNHPIYKETIRNIKRVDTIKDLISTPSESVKDGTIYYVSNVEKNIAIIDNDVFEIKYEYVKNEETSEVKILRYVSLIKNYDYIKIGDSRFFTSTIIVYDKDGNEAMYSLDDKSNGYEVKAYIIDSSDDKPQFICKADMDGYYTIDNFMVLDDFVTDTTTNYFIIDDAYYSDRLASNNDDNGWRRLDTTDSEYIKINTIENYYKGNNPHNGNMVYDSGHEYLTYFKRLFKHSIDNDLFDERCYDSYYYDLDNEISNYGFSGLIHDNEEIVQYFPYISGLTESKIHYFGNYYKKDEDSSLSSSTLCKEILFYGENEDKRTNLENMYKNTINDEIVVKKYILNSEDVIGGSPYSAQTGTIDEVTNQILNNKRITIKFILHNEWHTNQGQCEVKYLDSIVMNYLTQMIPSTAIVDIKYVYNGYMRKWECTEECRGYDKWEICNEMISNDSGQTWEASGKQKETLIEENSEDCGYVPPIEQDIIYTGCSDFDKCEYIQHQISYDGGETWENVGEPSVTVIEHNSEDCGYVPPVEPIYQWVEDGTMCDGHDKYAKEVEQVSYDNGTTWQNTGNIRKGELIERDSPDCGYVPPIEQDITYTGCSDFDKCEYIQHQISYDGGETWENVGEPSVTVIEHNSEDCGYVPKIDTSINIRIVTNGERLFMNHVTCEISLQNKNGGSTINLSHGDVQFINAPCPSPSYPSPPWSGETQQLVHLEGELLEDLSNYYLVVNFNTCTLKRQKAGMNECDTPTPSVSSNSIMTMNGRTVTSSTAGTPMFKIDMNGATLGDITVVLLAN